MDALFLVIVFAIASLCGVAIAAVACMDPEGSDARQALDAHESHPFAG